MESPLHVGAFECNGISGISLARGAEVLGVRMAAPHYALGLFDDKDLLLTLEAPSEYAPDLSYVRYTWRVPVTFAGIRKFANWPRTSINAPTVYDFAPGEAARVTLEWYRAGDIVYARYTTDLPVRLGLIVNGCFAPAVVRQATPDSCRLQQGESTLAVALNGPTETPLLVNDRREADLVWCGATEIAGNALALYPVPADAQHPLYLTLALAPTVPYPDATLIDGELSVRAEAYARARMRSAGGFPGAAEAVAGLAGYSRTYDPQRQRLQTTVNRTWAGANKPGLVFGWDNFFTSYIAAWENPALAAASLEHVVGTYGERGIAHGPTQRNLIIPLQYCRTLDILDDEALARRTWPVMMDFMRFWFADRGDGRPWRDGNGDGLIESGSSMDLRETSLGRIIQDAMDETGYDELPLYSAGFTEGRRGLLAEGVDFDRESRTLTITLVCQNSLYIAACRAMTKWATRLGSTEDADWLRAEGERVTARMRERLWDAEDGRFRDRLWSGDFSPVKPMTTFFPLLAGLCDDAGKSRLRAMLLDPAIFWGENLTPTVSRGDPAYNDGLDGRGNYWRGNCWPPTTYMVYLAIKEAGWDDIAAEYARRVTAQFLEYWTAYGHAYENYPSEGKVDHRFLYVQNWGGRELRYVWAAMLPLCGLEELFAPEMTREGVRFGNPHLAEETRWSGFRYAGQRLEAIAGPARTVVTCDAWAFQAEPGVAVRAFVQRPDGIRFTATGDQAAITLRSPNLNPHSTLHINGQPAAAEAQEGTLRFTLPAGESAVVIR